MCTLLILVICICSRWPHQGHRLLCKFFSCARRSTNVNKARGNIIIFLYIQYVLCTQNHKYTNFNILNPNITCKQFMHEEEMRGCHNYPWREGGGNKERLLIVCKSVGMSSIMSAAGAEHPNPCDTTNNPQPTPPLTTSPGVLRHRQLKSRRWGNSNGNRCIHSIFDFLTQRFYFLYQPIHKIKWYCHPFSFVKWWKYKLYLSVIK